MTYVGEKLLVFIIIKKKTLVQICLVYGWYTQLATLPWEPVLLVDVLGAWLELSGYLSWCSQNDLKLKWSYIFKLVMSFSWAWKNEDLLVLERIIWQSFPPLTSLLPQQDGFRFRKQNEIQVFISCLGSRGIVLWSRSRSMKLSVWIWPHNNRLCSGNRKRVMPIFSEMN